MSMTPIAADARHGPAPASRSAGELLHLHAAGVSLVLDCRGPRLPRVLHWGRDLGDHRSQDLAALALGAVPAVIPNGLDVPAQVAVLPEHATGWAGLPGLRGHRGGTHWSALFAVDQVRCAAEPGAGGTVTVAAADPTAGLALDLELQLTADGLLRVGATVTNVGTDRYTLDGLVVALPVPGHATELLDLTGRWGRERSPQRSPFRVGAYVRDGRRGRTGSDATLVLVAGEAGFGFGSGQVWGVHVGWSGNHRTYADRLPSGEAVVGGGELLTSGEVRLAPGQRYRTPWLYAAFGDGLDELSARFHRFLRSRPGHPRAPRPVVLNTWEAVYFDHDLPRLWALAEAGAEVGAELFVLDDGWFRGRRDDRAGLGDWYVDEQVWPAGLHPIADHVRALGMGFGLWVEPEMVSPDSALARAHPEWILAVDGRRPPPIRAQQVLDVANPDVYSYLLARLDALVTEYRLAYLKWDHNRDLIDAGHGNARRPAVHGQTLAVYRLLAELRERQPGLEIESCSSGGARVDLGILAHTDRVWASDCIDALERQFVQRWTALLLPPELTGSHVGPQRAHTTGRRHDLSFRAGTALFGHFGIEWDLASASPAERAELAVWVRRYKEMRGWLHRGRVVRADHPDPALLVHGIVAADRGQALFALVATATGVTTAPGRVRLPGLDPAARYRVRPLHPGDRPTGTGLVPPPWLSAGLTASGAVLSQVGLQAPPMHPEQLLLLHLTAEG